MLDISIVEICYIPQILFHNDVEFDFVWGVNSVLLIHSLSMGVSQRGWKLHG